MLKVIKTWDEVVTLWVTKSKQKYINYIGGFMIPSNIYDRTFLQNYWLVALIWKLIS